MKLPWGRSNLMLFIAALAVACTTVRVDPDAAGGGSQSDGDDHGNFAGPTVSTGPAVTVDSTSSGNQALCDEFCESTGDCFLDCQGVCDGYQGAPCVVEGIELMECLTEELDPTTCEDTGGCNDAIHGLLSCRQKTPPTCAEEECVVTAQGCVCSRQCDDGEEKAICQISGVDSMCSCYFNGTSFLGVSGPSEPGFERCSLVSGACSSEFGAQP